MDTTIFFYYFLVLTLDMVYFLQSFDYKLTFSF